MPSYNKGFSYHEPRPIKQEKSNEYDLGEIKTKLDFALAEIEKLRKWKEHVYICIIGLLFTFGIWVISKFLKYFFQYM